jgi:cysteine synthase
LTTPKSRGFAKPGGTIIEGTINTGIGLSHGHCPRLQVHFHMSDKQSAQQDILKRRGAEVIVCS